MRKSKRGYLGQQMARRGKRKVKLMKWQASTATYKGYKKLRYGTRAKGHRARFGKFKKR